MAEEGLVLAALEPKLKTAFDKARDAVKAEMAVLDGIVDLYEKDLKAARLVSANALDEVRGQLEAKYGSRGYQDALGGVASGALWYGLSTQDIWKSLEAIRKKLPSAQDDVRDLDNAFGNFEANAKKYLK